MTAAECDNDMMPDDGERERVWDETHPRCETCSAPGCEIGACPSYGCSERVQVYYVDSIAICMTCLRSSLDVSPCGINQ